MKVTTNMNRKANGSDTDGLDNGTSVIIMIPKRPPKISRERIISEFMMCFIRCTSISCVSYEIVMLDLRRAFSQSIVFKKVVSKYIFYHTLYIHNQVHNIVLQTVLVIPISRGPQNDDCNP